MAMELLRQIQEAEKQAEQIRQDAAHEARELMKAAETQIASQARQDAADIKAKVQQVLADAGAATDDEIHTIEVRQGIEREEMKRVASAKVASAGRAVFERIVG